MITIETNAMEINLPDGETQVRFTAGYPYFWLRNDSSDTVLISLSPNIAEGKDGVISIPAGSSNGTMHGHRLNDLYISGSGKVMVMGTGSADNPFKSAGKGGGDGGTVDLSGYAKKEDVPVPSEVINSSSTNETVSTSKSVFDYVISMLASAGFKPVKVTELPKVGSDRVLYLLPKDDLLSGNLYDEYLWIDGAYELVGTTAVDLSNYATQSDLSVKQDIVTKPPITDNSVDWNTLTETAIYPVGIQNGEGLSDSSTHGLSSAYPYGFLIVMARLNYNGWLYQLYINDRSEVYIRSLYTSWRSWVRIDAGAIDLSELRAKIEAIETTGWNFKSPIFDGPEVAAKVLCKIPVSTNTTNPGNLRQNISFILCGGINLGNVFKGTYLIEVSNRNKKFSSSITKLSGSADAKFYYYEENDYWVLCVGNVGYLSSLTMTVLNADNKKPDDILKNLEYGSLEVTAYPVENMTALPLQKMLTSEDITPEMIDKINNL